jgi:hypothetical protein
MRETSVEAYQQVRASGYISKVQKEVYDCLYQNGPLTAQEVWKLLRGDAGDNRINGITPRFSELERLGVVSPVGERNCTVTNRNCVIWDVTVNNPVKPIPKRPIKTETLKLVYHLLTDIQDGHSSSPQRLESILNEVKGLIGL